NAGSGDDTFTITDTVNSFRSPATLIFGNNGNDTFNVQKTTGRLTIDGSFGNDIFNIGSADNKLDAIQGPLSVDGSFGTDTLNVTDQGSPPPPPYTQTATTLDRNGAARITFANVESLKVNKGPVQGTPPAAESLALSQSGNGGRAATLTGRLTDADPVAKL